MIFDAPIATHLSEHLGVQPHIVEALLNHQSGAKRGVAGIYNRASYWDERVAAQSRGTRVSLSLLVAIVVTTSFAMRVTKYWLRAFSEFAA